MERTPRVVERLCSNCEYHDVMRFGGDAKVVCTKNPPQTFGAFFPSNGPPGPGGPKINFIYETVYPQPPIPCKQHVFATNATKEDTCSSPTK